MLIKEEYRNEILDKYIILRKDLDLHFWNDSSIITNHKGFQFRFTKMQTDILELCTGKFKVQDIIEKILTNYNGDTSENEIGRKNILYFIRGMVRKKFLITLDRHYNKQEKKTNFTGERGKFYPYTISIEITNRCNFSCDFCYKSSEKTGNNLEKDFLDKIYNNLKGKVREIRFLGGEPFLYPNFESVITKFSEYFKISIVTNGSVFHKFPDQILKKIDSVQFSLYGYSEKSYMKNTLNREGWNNLKLSINKANELQVPNRICLTLGKEHVSELEKYVVGAIEAKASEISFGIPSPVGRAFEDYITSKDFHFTKKDYKDIYFKMREIKKKYHTHINVVVWQHGSLKREEAPAAFSECSECLECGGGWYSLVVSQSGRIRPCELLSEEIFDYGGYEAIDKIINGNFFVDELSTMTYQYEKELLANGLTLNDVCFALQKFNDDKTYRRSIKNE